jgi:enoyl-CoA hydratase/carnithine racemase
LPRIVGNAAALHAVLTGARFPAADAFARGFVDEVVPRAALRVRARELADELAARSAVAAQAAKHLAWSALDAPLAVGLAREGDVARRVATGPTGRAV